MADDRDVQPAQPPQEGPPPAPQPPAVENTSGQGGPVPDEVRRMGWNWGAFWLTWIWGISHGVWNSFLVLILGIIWSIVLGVKGNEWAWQNRRFDSIEHFRQTQAAWSKWGWIVFIVCAVIWIVMMVFGVGAALFAGAATSGAGGLSPLRP